MLECVHRSIQIEEPLILVYAYDVTRPVPKFPIPLDKAFGGLFGFVPVSPDHMLGGDQQFSGFTRRNRIKRVGIHKPDLLKRCDFARASCRSLFTHGCQRDAATGFRGPISLIERLPELLKPSVCYLSGQDVAAGEAVLEGTQVIVVHSVMFENHAVHGGNAEEGQYLISLDMVKEAVQIHPGEQDKGIARKDSSQAHLLTENMEKRTSLNDDILSLGNKAFTDCPLLSRGFQK